MHNLESPDLTSPGPIFRVIPVKTLDGDEGWIIGKVTTVFGALMLVFESVKAESGFRVLNPIEVQPREWK